MRNNFDYTSVPKELIYCDRQHLDDFGVDEPYTLNYFIHEQLFEWFSKFAKYESLVCEFFNLAYYICTVALVDKHPERRIGAFKEIIGYAMHYQEDFIASVYSIALLQIRLHHWDSKSRSIERLADALEDELKIKTNEETYQKLYLNISQTWTGISIIHSDKDLPAKSEFKLREINQRVLNNAWTRDKWLERFGTDEDLMFEFITAIGKTEDEQTLIAKFLHDELTSAFNDLLEYISCFESLERKIHQLYHPDEERAEIDAQIETKQVEECKLQENYKEENAKLRVEIEKLRNEQHSVSGADKSLIAELEEENDNIKEQLEKIRSQEKGIAPGINQGQSALLGLSLANVMRFNYRNKKKDLAPMIHKLFGWGEAKIAKCIASACEKEERDELANIFKDLSPQLYQTIMNWGELPPEETPQETPK